MRMLITLVAFCFTVSAGEPLPILGLAHVGLQVSDMEKANHFYQGVLGFDPAFSRRKPDGSGIAVVVYKINEDQYLEVSPGTADQDRRLTHVSVYTNDIEKMHRMLAERGLNPSDIQAGKDGNRNFSVKDPDGFRFEITQYMPGSLHRNVTGQALSERRISSHLLHAGIVVTNLDAALKFYKDGLGLEETWRGGPTDTQIAWVLLKLPGANGDQLELMVSDPKPNRQRLGSMLHINFEVPSIQPAATQAKAQGALANTEPRIARNDRWMFSLFDPDGTRIEFMDTKPADRRTKVLNEFMRVLDVTDTPHNKSALHQHTMNRVMVYLDAGTQRLISDTGRITDQKWKAGDVAWSPAGGMHTSENTGTAPMRIIEVELTNKAAESYKISEIDPLAADRRHYEMILENAQVRVYRARLESNAATAMHEHLGPRLTILLADTKLKLTTPDNSVHILEGKRGDMLWGTVAKHTEQNQLNRFWEAVIVEPK